MKKYIILTALLLLVSTLACVSIMYVQTPGVDVITPLPKKGTTTSIPATATPVVAITETDIPPTRVPTTTSTPTPTIPPPTEESETNENKRPESDETGYDPDGRPILSGEETILDTEHFRIHYTLGGSDAISATDHDHNQYSDYADQVAQALEYVWWAEIEQFGWAAPPPDEGIGGDDRYDIYLQEVLYNGTMGYTEGSNARFRSNTQNGDNPNTPAVETRAMASYMVLDNDYNGLEEYSVEHYDPLDIMRSTAAHEFNHACQFGYDGEEPADWLWEATATWMQDEVYDDTNDVIENIYSVVKSPDTCQTASGGKNRVEDEYHWYGEWIFLRYISELYGQATVRAIWEYTPKFDGYEAIEAALSDAGTTIDETFRGFSIALLTRSFEEGTNYPTVRLEGEATPGNVFTPLDGVGQMGADYVEIKSLATLQVTLNAADLEGLLLGIKGDEASLFTMNGNQVVLNAGPFTHLYLLIINLNQAQAGADCQVSAYTVDIQTTSQTTNLPTSETFSVPNFKVPKVEPLLDPKEYWGEDWEEGGSGSVNAPPELIPAYLPPNYELIEAFQVDASDYGDSAIWYIPSGGTATEIDFYGPGDEDVVVITASASPYFSLNEWMAEADFEPFPDEFQNIKGVTVIIEDYTDEVGFYSFATFIRGDQFIVVEGNISVEEIAKVVESLLP